MRCTTWVGVLIWLAEVHAAAVPSAVLAARTTEANALKSNLPTRISPELDLAREERDVEATDAPFAVQPSAKVSGASDVPDAIVTPAPAVGSPPDGGLVGTVDGYVQQTYYTCITIGADSHCGWHEPIVKADKTSAGALRVVRVDVLDGAMLGLPTLWLLMQSWR